MFVTTPISHEEGAKLIAGKAAVTRAVWDRLPEELQARAYVITGVECAATIRRVRELTAKLPQGGDWDEIKSGILNEISPWLVDPNADEETRAKQESRARVRATTLLRLHGWQAYSQTQFEMMEAHRDAFPFRQYLSRDDGRERPSHRALHGKILPSAHSFWRNHTPPWEFGCRCRVVPITAAEAGRIEAREKKLPPEARQVLPPEMLREIEAGNIVDRQGGRQDIRTPREREGAGHYEWRPGDARLSLGQVLAAYSPEERRVFEAWAENQIMEDGRSLRAWLAGETQDGKTQDARPEPAPAVTVVPAVSVVMAAMQALAAEDAIFQGRARGFDLLEAKLAGEWAAARRDLSPEDYAAVRQRIADDLDGVTVLRQKLAEERKALVERARETVSVPAGLRGRVRMQFDKAGKATRELAQRGAAIVERYTAEAILPEVVVTTTRSRRMFYRNSDRRAHLNTTDDRAESVAAHEITHGTEAQHPDVLKAAKDFLAKRAGTDPLKRLSDIYPRHGYRASEVAWEDEWIARGGHAYSGKYYASNTELLTMGIERLHADPLAFYREDPDYFAFVVKTLGQRED